MKSFGRRGEDAPSAAAVAPKPPKTETNVKKAEDALQQLRGKVIAHVDPDTASVMPMEQLRIQLESLVHDLANSERIELAANDERRLAAELADDMVGFGPLEPVLRDERISDIMVNGPHKVYVEIGGKMRRTEIQFRDAAQVASIAQKMASLVGRRVDESSPLLDCRLLDGSRVNVVFPPLAVDGACISIRKFARHRIDFAAMVGFGSMSEQVAHLLEIAARCRLNIVISGGHGLGEDHVAQRAQQPHRPR
jgi:pilus assembly protein CpaF